MELREELGLLQYSKVNSARYCLQLMTDHTFQDCDKAIAGIKASIDEAAMLLMDVQYLENLKLI